MQALAADDATGAHQIAGQVEYPGQFGDLGAVMQAAVLVESGVPQSVGDSADRAADRFGDLAADREEGTCGIDVKGS
uniref:Uncharacterized protein n=1 Tax=Streptomyces sp. NBC_00003 TaxID=2903608 RepID=A0AAU2V261_9ACTN